MFSYNVKLAMKSMRRNPVMTALMIGAIAVGIGISMTTLTVYYLMSGNPIPAKSDLLFAVTLDSWNPLRPFDDDYPERGPHQLTFADAERPTGPAGVHQPALCAVFGHFLFEQIGVLERMVHHERCTKTGTECDLRLDTQTDLRTGDLGRITTDKVVHRLFGTEPGNRR